jgi:dihydroorotate dehydrogenase
MDQLILLRSRSIRLIYKNFLRPILFSIEPEAVHDFFINAGIILGSNLITKSLLNCFFSYSNKKLKQKILGIKFDNPIGLAAGFDKDGKLTEILPSIGFGFVEVGSITGQPSQGNLKPRLWRLLKSRSLAVNYGLKNEGADKIYGRLKGKKFKIPVGTSIAKTNEIKTSVLAAAVKDYVLSFKKLADIGDYFAVNISCPNVAGDKFFVNPDRLSLLLSELRKISTNKPIFLKISPDLSQGQIDDIIYLAKKYKVQGFICSNVTKNRNLKTILDKNLPEKGGLSGKVVESLSNDLIKYVYQKTKGKFVIIGCGGVFSAEDAYKKIKLGASLIQLFTGLIFEGPQLVSEINQGLVALLKKDGFRNISQAVGKENKG